MMQLRAIRRSNKRKMIRLENTCRETNLDRAVRLEKGAHNKAQYRITVARQLGQRESQQDHRNLIRQLDRTTKRQEFLDLIAVDSTLTAQELEDKLSACKDREKEQHSHRDLTGNDGIGEDEDDREGELNGGSFFADFIKSPEKALLLYYINSGLYRFRQWVYRPIPWNSPCIDENGINRN